MEYVAGTDLASLLEQRGPLAVAVACDYVRQAALGLQHAHERGLVHRDIKPANLLLNDKGVIKVMDLGLARLRPDPAGKPSRVLTQLGTVMGTADYIAPEQAVDSSRVDARADVYSLGCTLYHLVTGQPPFPKGSFGQKLKWHQQKEPPAVEQLRADVPPVLAAAVRKLMAKRPEDRYQTAAEVVTALTEVLAVMHGAPVARVVAADPPSGAVSVVPTQVKPAGPGPKPPSTSWLVRTQAKAADSLALLGQKARKRRLFLSAAGIVLVLGLLTWLVLAITGRNPQPQPTSGENLPEQPGAKKASPLDQLKRAKIPAYELAMAERWAPKKSLPQLVAILGDSRLKHWAAVTAVTFSPNGKVLASASQDFSVKLWDPGSGEELRTLLGHTGGVTSLAFSPDGKQLASGSQDGSVRLSDPATGKELRTLKGHKARIAAVAFSANGKLLASAGDDKTLRVWATESGQQLFEIRGAFRSVAFSPDGETLVTGGYDRKVQWWEAGTGKERPIRASAEHGEVIHSVAFSPDGKLVASGSDDQMVIWDAATGKELHKQKSRVACVVFSKDSKTLATVSMNGEVRLWDTELGKPLPKWPRYPDGLQTVAFSPDGKTVASGGFAGMVYLWDVEQNKELFDLPGHRGSVMSLAFDPVAFQTLISGGWDRNLRQWDSATGKELRSRAGEAKAVWPLAISPDGKVLAAGSRDHHVSLWEAPPLEKRRTLRTPEQHSVSAVALYAEGKKLATGGGSVADMNVRLWDLDTSQELKLLEGHKATITSLVATADGKILASASEDGSVRLWDLTAGKAGPVLTPQKKAAVQAVTFSRNGQFLASGDAEGVVRLWQVTMGKEGIKGKEMGQLAKHAQAVGSVAFSPDGQLLASAAKDGTVRLTWVAKPGTKDIVFNLAPPGAPINQVAFDEPGRHLVTANGNGTLYILRVR
jgi:WD40 repeat protein